MRKFYSRRAKQTLEREYTRRVFVYPLRPS
jgi:hypothetical protein